MWETLGSWGTRNSCWIKHSHSGGWGEAPPSDQKWTSTTGCAIPAHLAWSFLRFQLPCCCFVVFVAPLQWFMPSPGWVFANIFYLYSQALFDCNHPFPANFSAASSQRTLHPNLVVISEELQAWGAFSDFHSQEVTVFLSVGLIRSSPSRLRLFTCSLLLRWAVHSVHPQCRRISVKGCFPWCNPTWLLLSRLPLSLHITPPMLHAPHLFPEVRFRIRWECVQWH